MDIRYIAGFFDGEGYVGFGFRMRPEVRIVHTYLPVLEQLKELYGGGIYPRKKTPVRHKIAYDWVLVDSQKVYKFLSDIRPYLLEKKERVELVLKDSVC